MTTPWPRASSISPSGRATVLDLKTENGYGTRICFGFRCAHPCARRAWFPAGTWPKRLCELGIPGSWPSRSPTIFEIIGISNVAAIALRLRQKRTNPSYKTTAQDLPNTRAGKAGRIRLHQDVLQPKRTHVRNSMLSPVNLERQRQPEVVNESLGYSHRGFEFAAGASTSSVVSPAPRPSLRGTFSPEPGASVLAGRIALRSSRPADCPGRICSSHRVDQGAPTSAHATDVGAIAGLVSQSDSRSDPGRAWRHETAVPLITRAIA